LRQTFLSGSYIYIIDYANEVIGILREKSRVRNVAKLTGVYFYGDINKYIVNWYLEVYLDASSYSALIQITCNFHLPLIMSIGILKSSLKMVLAKATLQRINCEKGLRPWPLTRIGAPIMWHVT